MRYTLAIRPEARRRNNWTMVSIDTLVAVRTTSGVYKRARSRCRNYMFRNGRVSKPAVLYAEVLDSVIAGVSTFGPIVSWLFRGRYQFYGLASGDVEEVGYSSNAPEKQEMTTTKRTSPKPPLGAYPQFRLCDHRGRTPKSANTRITSKIVPAWFASVTFSREVQPPPRLHS